MSCSTGSVTGRLRWPRAQPGVMPENPADQKQALAWFESEHAVLVTVLRQATGFDTHIWQLAWALASYFEYHGHWRDWRAVSTALVDAADDYRTSPPRRSHLQSAGVARRPAGQL